MQKKSVIMFCKHPEPGLVKTRLAVELGKERAAFIYQKILENILIKVNEQDFDIALHCFPDTHHPFLRHCQDEYEITLYEQKGDNLGARMYNAMNQHLKNSDSVVLIGSDCPQLNSEYINNAFQKLEEGNDIVLGPAVDGGYVLIGAKQVHESIFNNISWSTCDVLKTTKDKIKLLNWSVVCLPYVRDMDDLEDYYYFAEHKEYKYLFDA